MNLQSLLSQVELGEDSMRQFKVNARNAQSLASEMAAFANAKGGTLFIGAADDGSTPGLSPGDVGRINQLISNAASESVRSLLTVQTENVSLENGRLAIVLSVKMVEFVGLDQGRQVAGRSLMFDSSPLATGRIKGQESHFIGSV